MGSCNRFGRMTGDDVVYLYPDLHTALVGSWSNDIMQVGRLSTVTGVTMRVRYVQFEVENLLECKFDYP